jgi:hypothetical protein
MELARVFSRFERRHGGHGHRQALLDRQERQLPNVNGHAPAVQTTRGAPAQSQISRCWVNPVVVSEGRSDAELLQGARLDAAAFVAFYDRYEAAVVDYFNRHVRDPEVVADLTAGPSMATNNPVEGGIEDGDIGRRVEQP